MTPEVAAYLEKSRKRLAPRRARGMTEIFNAAGLARESRDKALRAAAEPQFDAIHRVCHALGVKLVVQPLRPRGSGMGQ